MISVPDIIVLDFCEWLNKQFKKGENQTPLILDVIIGNGNNRYLLKEYAQEYLDSQQVNTGCFFKKKMTMFLQSDEFNEALEECAHYRHTNDCCKCIWDFDLWFRCPEIRHAIYRFEKKNREFYYDGQVSNVTADHLADYTRWLLLHEDNDNVKQKPPLLNLLINSSTELAEELNFFNWIEKRIDCATDIRKMPSTIFEGFVDNYVKECEKTDADKKRLLKAYQRTGWEELCEKFQILLRVKRRKSKSMSETLERYYSHYGRYKCIILPLADDESQSTYTTLISESWEDLNSCSGNYLDIYYSEKDTGKSGFDIAKRINSLPDQLKLKAPCLIVWEQSMRSAENISISGLNNIQIVELIKSIVESIRCENKFNYIIEEARNKVKELQEEKKSIANYYAPVITGDGNVVGDYNAVGTGNISGNSNTVTGNVITPDISIKHIVEDFDAAISEIHKSDELNEDMKKILVEIFETAKSGVSEQSREKQEGAKKKFQYTKSFLTKVAPFLVENLANIATIATFFGLVL